MRAALVGIALLTLSSTALAQDDGPKKGTWGAEGLSGGASLLRFRSPTSAWVLGVNAFFVREDVDPDSPLGLDDENSFSGRVQGGIRKYHRAQERVRPYTTLSALVGYDNNIGMEGPEFGAAFEVGSAYFFTPRVSLGVSGEVGATYQSGDRDFGTPQTVKTIIARFSGFRLVGAVYF